MYVQNFGGSNHIIGTAEPKIVKCFTQVDHPQRGVVLWRDCFIILPFAAMQRVRQRQLSYLLPLPTSDQLNILDSGSVTPWAYRRHIN